MKKLFAALMALAMILAMSATAFAANNQTYSLTINGANGHTYAIYQIYTGDISKEDDGTTVLSNVRYGQNHVSFGYVIGDLVPADELKDFINAQNPTELITSMITDQNPYRSNIAPTGTDTAVTVTGLPAGYYMIVDISTNLPAGQTLSPIILQMVEDVTVTSKHASISSEKKVADTNDSYAANETVWQDSADYDIGDSVPFMISATIPSTYAAYTDGYTLTFHDKQAAGFDAPVVSKVYILQTNGNKIAIPEGTTGYSVIPCTSGKCEFGGCSFTVQVSNIAQCYGQNTFTVGDKIVVEYTSVLNSSANVGDTGNENSMYVCHPDGHTIKDYVTVLTYELKINKIDGANNQPLDGAAFTLYKWSAAANNWVVVGVKTAGDGISAFTWSGIDDGKYKLSETQTPESYNSIADIEFEVAADHKVEWVSGGNSAFEDVIAKDASGNVVFADRNDQLVEDGLLEGNIANHKGTVLPETGAEGTFFLITGGTLLVVVAAVFMITRKKMSIYED